MLSSIQLIHSSISPLLAGMITTCHISSLSCAYSSTVLMGSRGQEDAETPKGMQDVENVQ